MSDLESMEMSKPETSEKFTCPLCKKKYDTPEEMAECILKYSVENKKRKENERAEKLIREKAIRKQAILDLNEKLEKLVHEYQEDYNDPFIIDRLHNYNVDLINSRDAFKALVDSIFK